VYWCFVILDGGADYLQILGLKEFQKALGGIHKLRSQDKIGGWYLKCQLYICRFSLTKFIYSEKATKFCEISTLLFSYVVPVKSKVEILQKFVAFSEYMNFMYLMSEETNQS
jgi:hypothetical protein